MLEPADPYTKEEIASAAVHLEASVRGFFEELAADVFFSRPSVGWSAAENLKHLIKAAAAVNLGLATPRPLLGVFGLSREKSRRLSAVREAYLARLAAGARAGIYAPFGEPPPADGEARRAGLLGKWNRTQARFVKALNGWSEEELDRYRLPHPIIGRISVREMCMFGLLHVEHHIGIVRARLADRA